MSAREGLRPTVKRQAGRWVVTCGACDDTFASLFHPWAKATSWRGAMALARWHAERHAEQRCPTCLHEPPLPPLVVMAGDRSLFKVGGRLYRIAGDRIFEMTEAQR